jgi:apolipoprotein N-acyltransferase
MFPPFGLAVLLLLYGVLYRLVRQETSARRVMLPVWWFFFGQYVGGLYWISNALLVPPAQFLWMWPLAVAALPAGLALFPMLLTGLWQRLDGRTPWGFVLALLVAELARGHLLTGFPWNLSGYAFSWLLPYQQVASLGGVYLLSLLALLLGVLPLAYTRRRAVVWLSLLVVPFGWGSWRLATAVPESGGPLIRIVQPSIPQSLKFDAAAREQNLYKYIGLSLRPAQEPLAAVIWGETATGYLVEAQEAVRAALAQAVPAGGVLITGTVRRAHVGQQVVFSNGMVVLDGEGSLLGAFDKFHLVPFGEYVPLSNWLPLPAIAADMGAFTPGPGPRSLPLPGLPSAGPLICYEVIFPGEVVDEANRPGWLLNLTNDGWYGNSTGPYQHFHISALRAVEEGLPMVRAANTGVSGVIDAYGRETARLGLNESGILDARLPAPLKEPTVFSQYRYSVLMLMMVLVALVATISRRKM